MVGDESNSQHLGPRGRRPQLDSRTEKVLLDTQANSDPPTAMRAAAILALSKGKGVEEVSASSGLAQSTVSELRARFNQHGIATVYGNVNVEPLPEQTYLVELPTDENAIIQQLSSDQEVNANVRNRAKVLETATHCSTITEAARFSGSARSTIRRAISGYRSIGLHWVYSGNSQRFSIDLSPDEKLKLQQAVDDATLSADVRCCARFVLRLAGGDAVYRASVSAKIGTVHATEVAAAVSKNGPLSILDESLTSFQKPPRQNSGPNKTVVVKLAATEREWLEHLVAVEYDSAIGSYADGSLIAARAKALLVSEKGFSDTKAGSHCGLSKQQVKALRYSYCTDGLRTALGLVAGSDQLVRRYSGPRQKTSVSLSEEERLILEAHANNGAGGRGTDEEALKAARARALLASDKGLSDTDAGKEAGLSRNQVLNLRKAYNSDGLHQVIG